MPNIANQPARTSPHLRSIVACLVGTFVLRIASAVMGSMIQLYFGYIDRSVYPLSATMRGIALAVFFLPELIGSPVLGAWSDRYGRKSFMLFGSLFGGVAVQLAALTTNLGALVVTRILTGLSTASAFPATLGYLSAETTSSESLRGRVMGLFQIATLGGTVIGILIGGRLWDIFLNHAFTINNLIYVVSLTIFLVGVREIRLQKDAIHAPSAVAQGARAFRQSLDYYRAVFFSPVVLRFAPAWLTINIILGIWLNQIIGQLVAPPGRFPSQLLSGILGESARAGTQISLYATILAFVFTIGIVGWGAVLGRLRRTAVMLIGMGGLFALCMILFAINHSTSLADPVIPVYIAFVLIALFVVSGLMPASLTYLADVTEAKTNDRGAIMGLYTIFFGAGQFIGTLIGGPFADWAAIDGILLITTLLGLLAAGMLLRLNRFEPNAIPQAHAILSKE